MNEKNIIMNSNEQELINKINELSLISILKYKKGLSLKFIVNYILNEKYYGLSEEYDIDILMILKYQKHLTYDEIYSAISKD